MKKRSKHIKKYKNVHLSPGQHIYSVTVTLVLSPDCFQVTEKLVCPGGVVSGSLGGWQLSTLQQHRYVLRRNCKNTSPASGERCDRGQAQGSWAAPQSYVCCTSGTAPFPEPGLTSSNTLCLFPHAHPLLKSLEAQQQMLSHNTSV